MKPIYECRCDGRLLTKRFTRLSYTGLVVELEHLKIKTRLTNEKFASVKGEKARAKDKNKGTQEVLKICFSFQQKIGVPSLHFISIL